ncbi:hypothetical protein DM01DRAFT_1331682 [Hesseltinella vesiculosa]|uniref:Argonaute complex, subunit Arb1 n=1 Tax=Hesseltinella vesiculosa TaxID=101127 RepID=A0A1X2GW30_9FUNG|nr:hypothetical protein DM01DRAFT_1331682 [Hesseltinella vesiculosa]
MRNHVYEKFAELGVQIPEGLSTPASVMLKDDATTSTDNNNPNDPKPEKKKKRKKKKNKNLPEAGTDLPDDYEERYKEDLVTNPFDLSIPLSQRVEYAIWKYKRNHKFSQENIALFYDYLRFGGVDIGPNSFLGGGKVKNKFDEEEADEDTLQEEAAGVTVNDDELEEGVYVSFCEVAQVYLGNHFITSGYFISSQDYASISGLVDAFLNYLQIRTVCPDYTDDIGRAREIAALAKDQLPKCKRISMRLPGTFNNACGVVFGGEKQELVAMVDQQKEENVIPDWAKGNSKMMELAASCMDDVLAGGLSSLAKAKETVRPAIPQPDKLKTVDTRHYCKVKLKSIHSQEQSDVCRATFDFLDHSAQLTGEQADLFLDTAIAQDLVEGMVMTATLKKLSNGLWYIESGFQVYPSFYMIDQFANIDDDDDF